MGRRDGTQKLFGKVQERLNWQHWKCCEPQKGSVGSNPTLSARFQWAVCSGGRQ
jgi:hypothetical protein